MVSVCFYFQVHQPRRIKKYSIFDLKEGREDYFDEEKNREVMKKVASKCYIPANKALLELIRKHKGRFKVSFSLSGVFIEEAMKHAPEVIESFRELSRTGCVEFLAETYYHSLSSIYSKTEFKEQISLHKKLIKKLFKQEPKVFRNTELIFNNELANYVQGLGFKGMLAEGWHTYLGWRSPNFIYTAKTADKLKVLLKNYSLSDDVAFRFSNKGWKEYPLTAEKFASWVNSVNGNGNTVNLFMDYETFGEHQWESTGIFEFLKSFPGEVLKNPDNSFKTVSEVINEYDSVGEIDVHNYHSWADMERDLSAWLGNRLQTSAAERLHAMERRIKKLPRTKQSKKLLEEWRCLTTSDHFYYMCTKWFSDGDVHKYFNPYDTPYDAFVSFMNVLEHMEKRLEQLEEKQGSVHKNIGKEHKGSVSKADGA